MKMKVFISWSGERSRFIGQALAGWLPLVLQYVEPWFSQRDIGAGQRWHNALSAELEMRYFGILCITNENLVTPWIMYEAGALAKSTDDDTRVIPLLCDDIKPSDIAEPLTPFQAKKADKNGILGIVKSINQVAEAQKFEEVLRGERLGRVFEALWTDFETQLKNAPLSTGKKKTRSQEEILEELVSEVRALQTQLRSPVWTGPTGSSGYSLTADTGLYALNTVADRTAREFARRAFNWVVENFPDRKQQKLITGSLSPAEIEYFALDGQAGVEKVRQILRANWPEQET